MGRKPIVGGNWKCNPATLKEATDLLAKWEGSTYDKDKVEVVICPTAVHLPCVKDKLEGMGIMVATQNVSNTGMGAFTGEWCADHLVDFQIGWTLVGHSERRTKYGETDAITAEKVKKCQEKGIKVIFCIGELLEEREGGKTDEVNQRQLKAVLPVITKWEDIVVAYEPVWAIGTGKVATPAQAQETHKAIRDFMRKEIGDKADALRIQYGGSVSPANCKELISMEDIDGFLVGGASLKADFPTIMAACAA